MTELTTKNTNSASARNINANNLTITFGENARPMPGVNPKLCSLNVGQKIKASQSVKLMAKFASKNDLQAQMKTALQNSIAQASTSQQGALATALNVQNSKQEINQKVSNIVETKITNEVLNEVNGFLDNVNNGTMEFKGIFPCPITVNQEIISNQVVSMLSDAMIGNSVSTSTDTAASAASKQETSSKQQGVIDAMAGLMQGPIMIIGLIVVVLGILAYVFRGTISKIAEKKAGAFGAMLFGRRKVRFGRRRFR
jgi:hypothetical protein